jgi:hypothetical protein
MGVVIACVAVVKLIAGFIFHPQANKCLLWASVAAAIGLASREFNLKS